MKKEEQINKLIEQAINSTDGAQQAAPKPYLLTRINAKLAQQKGTMPERMLGFIGRPVIAISGLCLVVMINVLAIINNQPERINSITEQVLSSPDEFSNTIATIYDNENPE
ncbi:MAG: hypothetical protein ABIN67_24185 [Ferruginibacter sp.]